MKRIGLVLMATLILTCQVFSQIIHIPGDQPSIQAGINAAVDGDTVLVADSTYFENINFNGKAITVASHFLIDGDTSHISKTIIDGSQPLHPDTASVVRMISGEDSTSVLCGFKITGGTGMYMDASLCNIYPLSTIYILGGGIAIIDGGPTIKNNIITNNKIAYREGRVCVGGGISVIMSGNDRSDEKTLLIENNIVSNNQLHGGESGGAGMNIFVDKSNTESGMDIIIQGNIFTDNRITVPAGAKGVVGAGMLIGLRHPIRNGDYLIRNNSINNNKIETSPMPAYGEGGGIYLFYLESGANGNCAPKIYNNIISNNHTPDMAAGIGVYNWGRRSYNTSPSIFNNTIINNKSPISPGLDLVRVKTLVVNNIFSNQGANSETLEIKTNNASLHQYNNAIRGTQYIATGNINAVPIFEEDSYNLKEGSPGIGAGISSVEIADEIFEAPETDFYDNPRPDPVDMLVDMGAIESPFKRTVYIPDTAFLHALIEMGVDTDEDEQISYAEAEAITHLVQGGGPSLWGKDIADLTGIEAFINLVAIELGWNQITKLDFSHNEALESLECMENQLTSLDVSKNPALSSLWCGGNQLRSLDVNNNTLLRELYCSGNQITSLDISNNIVLDGIHCSNNLLSNLDVTNNTALNQLLCQGNKLTSLNISQNNVLGAEILGMGGPALNCSNNQLTSLDVSNNYKLRELVIEDMPTLEMLCLWEDHIPVIGGYAYYSESDTIHIQTKGSPNVYFTTECGANFVNIPDTAFLYALIDEAVDTNGDSLISYGEAEAITDLNVSGDWDNRGLITDMTGIEAFVNLTTLACHINLLTSLDVSNNTALLWLWCGNNQLSDLDVTNNTAMKGLSFGTGHPTYGFNCECDSTISNSNSIASIDVSKCQSLNYLDCADTPITSLDLRNNTPLIQLCLSSMESLNQVCVWESFVPRFGEGEHADSVAVCANGSPNVYFTTNCATGIKEPDQSDLKIYPNPFNSLLTIETDIPDHYLIQFTTLSGQQIFTEEMEGTTHQLDLSTLQKGVFFITIRSKDFVTTKKIIKLE